MNNEKILNSDDQDLWREFKEANAGLNDYLKPYKKPSELVDKLISKRIIIHDRASAERIIYTHNYYRLKAYFVPFLDLDKSFKLGTTFSDVFELYLIDQRVRDFILPLLAKLEVRLRAVIDNIVTSETQDPFWHLNENNFKNFDKISATLQKAERRVVEGKQEFIVHYREKYFTKKSYRYRRTPPFWIVSEIFTLEQLLTVVKNIEKDKFMGSDGKNKLDQCAREFGFHKYDSLVTNLQCILSLRNICAHHSRVWNANLLNPNGIERKLSIKSDKTNRLYSQLVMIHIMCKAQKIDDEIHSYFLALINSNPILIRDQRSMGFPVNWETDPFWLPISLLETKVEH